MFLITDTTRIDVLKAASKLPRGSGVILRDYELSEEARYELGLALKKICRKRQLLFFVAKTPALAKHLKADGLHLPEGLAQKARIYRRDFIISVSAHSRPALARAKEYGADIALLSPVFSKDGKKGLGFYKSATILSGVKGIKTYALGGVVAKKLRLLKAVNFQGFAAVSGLSGCGRAATK